VKKLAKRALKYKHELLTFILVPGVEPTNNVAERALRQGVRQRKIWGCFRTDEGAKNRDIMMSVMGTMKIQKQDFFTNGNKYILTKLK
jgi:transposase